MNNPDLNYILTVVLPVIIPVVVAMSVHLYQRLNASLPKNIKDFIQDVAGLAVQAVEQQYKDVSGPDKKMTALKLVSSILSESGVKNPDMNLVSSAIESAVYGLNLAKADSADATTVYTHTIKPVTPATSINFVARPATEPGKASI